jgi:hypothetical protein
MRTVVTLVLACVALAVGVTAAAEPSGAITSLRVEYWKDGTGLVPDQVWTLRCNPAGGSLRRPALACRRLSAGGPKLFAPIPRSAVCTQIYGGPQRARVVGVLAGRMIRASFSRRNGCAIDRWQRVSPWLLPPGGIT